MPELIKHLQLAQKVISWLALGNPQMNWAAWALDELVPHLAAMATQLRKGATRRNAVLQVQALAQPEPELPDPAAILTWVEQLKQAALASLASDIRSGAVSMATALQARDACMLVTAIGHTALTHRGSVLYTIKGSKHAATPCQLGGKCPGSGLCHGNRVQQAPKSAPAPAPSPITSLPQPQASYQLVLPHHKSSNQGGVGVALDLRDPMAIQLLEGYEKWARPVIVFVTAPEPTALFVTDSGKPFDAQTICQWWTSVHRWVAVGGRVGEWWGKRGGGRGGGAGGAVHAAPCDGLPACMGLYLHAVHSCTACPVHVYIITHHSLSLSLTHTLSLAPLARSKYGAPGPFTTLHNLRHVFITHRQDHPTAPGPNNEAAAAAMLHSTAQWDSTYDRRAKRRKMDDAVKGMEAYRAAMLPGSLLNPPALPSTSKQPPNTPSPSSDDEDDEW